jgi:hypothetical protein
VIEGWDRNHRDFQEEGLMEKASKGVAWTCIFSTFLLGCYSSSVIDPMGAEREEIYTGPIQFIVTKDGTEYEFKRPPAIVNDAIVGAAEIGGSDAVIEQHVSIPTSEVAYVSQLYSGEIAYLVTTSGAKYVFDEPPAIAERAVVGKAKFTERTKAHRKGKEDVSIPISDVAEIGGGQSGRIEYVVTKAGAKFTFDKPPTLENKTLRGEAQLAEAQLLVTVPLTDVAKVAVSRCDVPATVMLALGATALATLLFFAYVLYQN